MEEVFHLAQLRLWVWMKHRMHAFNDYVNKKMNESFNDHNLKQYIKTLKKNNKKKKHTKITTNDLVVIV